MAKARVQSKHSRAARRAASPSLDVDKSLTSLPRAQQTVLQRETILSERATAGVTKKQSKPKAKSKVQRLRQQKGIERAENILDQLEKKVEKSVGRAKGVKARRAEWEDLNRKSSATMFQNLNDEAEDNGDDDAMADAPTASKRGKPQPEPTYMAQNSVAEENASIDVDDDIS
ncbi:Alb1-domain-containing protein [Aspergillus coremiiformis]|uniref:Alb1-domain-containing protein n=1 Tax=Aspergillus coremiiformis TaxID=138285 RepID=A0A5N6ZIX6_9EURO|nr:Alb1-domain-containing protein [Aspergillus coremiiformis]